MKGLFKFTLFLLAFSAIIFAIPAGAELSPAIAVLRREDALTKHCIGGDTVTFATEDFDAVAGESTKNLVICSLPRPEDGVLKLAGVDALPGQRLSASAVALLKFVPSSHFEHEAAFSFRVNDGAESRCVIRYCAVRNMAPVAASSGFSTYEGVCVSAPLDCYDPESDSLKYSIKQWPVGGTLRIENGCAMYLPTEGFIGNDCFIYTATDSAGNCSDSAAVNISVMKSSGRSFADMAKNPAEFAALRLTERGIMSYDVAGGACVFSPEKAVSRSEFAVMLVAATDIPLPSKPFPTNVFTDTANLEMHERFCIEVAVTGGFLPVDGESFRPYDSITEAEAAAMAENAGIDFVPLNGSAVLTKARAALLLSAALS